MASPALKKLAGLFRDQFNVLNLVAAIVIAVSAWWLFVGKMPLGVAGDWQLVPNGSAWPPGPWLLPLGVLFLFGGAAGLSAYDRFCRAKSERERTASARLCIVALMLLSLLWQWSLLGPGSVVPAPRPGQVVNLTLEGRFNILAAMWSDLATEYFGDAYLVTDARTFAREYTEKYQKPKSVVISHVATHPPGAVLFFYGIRTLTEKVPAVAAAANGAAVSLTGMTESELIGANALLRVSSARSGGYDSPTQLPPSALGVALVAAIVLSLIAVSIIPAVYWTAAAGAPDEVSGDIRGLVAAALFAFAPTLNLFSFTLDGVVAAGVAWAGYFLARRMSGGGAIWIVLSGAAMALTSFVSIGALAAVVICLAAILLHFRKEALPHGAAWLGGFLLTWALLWVLFPVNIPVMYKQAMAAHHMATLAHRSWAAWSVWNLVIWAFFCGWPLVVGLAVSIKRGVAEDLRSGAALPAVSLGLAALATMVVLTLSGNVRGEVERLWLFLLAPLAILAATHFPWRRGVGLLILQAIQTLLMAATLAPLVRPI